MANIFKQISELEKDYAHIEGDTLIKYNKLKKSPLIAYLLLIFNPPFIINRLYLGDRFSIFYIFIENIIIIPLAFFLKTHLALLYDKCYSLLITLFLSLMLIVILVFIGELIFIPFVCKRNNLVLKKQLSENPESVKNIFPTYMWVIIIFVSAFDCLASIIFFVNKYLIGTP